MTTNEIRFLFMPPVSDRIRAMANHIAAAVPEARIVLAETSEAAARELPQADGAYGVVPEDLLPSARRLRWLQSPQAAPPAGYYYPALVEHPLEVTNFRGIFEDRIPAHVLAYMLFFARGMHIYVRRQMAREWNKEDPAPTVFLPEATVLIVGVGSIGRETARLCAQFGMRVIGVDARETTVPEGVAALHAPDALDDLLPQADFIVATVPHTPKTEGMFDAALFARMKRTAFFINIGRGRTTKLADLDAVLRAGIIAGAGLDVYEIEPLPVDHPLWTAPNTLLTPHVAADGPTLEPRRTALVADNLRRLVEGRPLVNVVDKAGWY